MIDKSADTADVPVIRLRNAPGERTAWDRSRRHVYLWAVAERIFVTNSWQISSRLRIHVLRAFGARIGARVVFRPRTRISFPWKLTVGDDCWIGEGVWFHNQDEIVIGNDVVISQETFLTTGSHAYRRDMALITRPVLIDPGAWVTTRCIVLGGAHIGTSALITPGTVVSGDVPPNVIWSPQGAQDQRFL